MIDRRPAALVRCTDAADVMDTVDFIRDHDLELAIRGGGHSGAGLSLVHDGVTIDLSPMRWVRVDPVAKTAQVGGGTLLGDLDHAAHAFGSSGSFLPEDLNGFFAELVVPPGPPFPEEIHGHKMCGVVWCWTGDLERLEETFAPVQEPAPPAFHFTTPMLYPALQTMFDELIPTGLQWYWRGDLFDRITDDSIDVHAKYAEATPTDLSTLHLYPVDGTAHRVNHEDTAWGYRDAVWSGVIAGIDPEPANAETIKRWTVDYWEALHPHSMGAAYVNFIGAGEPQHRVKATYRDHYDRLAAIKHTYAPHNLFHTNQNIAPAR
ncbi:FAD-dependent oxidoreductase [Streptomyces violens]|uniref:FAD-dependent oxidoreductase n=1 Tax=Streptomyces violens TaxID=66377 RepID=UPI000A9D6E5A|nr:FAD-dependent oxidoreductase [Streptomyces violens]